MTFMERLEALCAEKGISKRKLEKGAGLGTASTSKWKTKNPNHESLGKLSSYFGVCRSCSAFHEIRKSLGNSAFPRLLCFVL